jgi:hypothetical protein
MSKQAAPPASKPAESAEPQACPQHKFIKAVMQFQRYTENQSISLDLATFYQKANLKPTDPFCELLEESFAKLTLAEHSNPVDRHKKSAELLFPCPNPSCDKQFKRGAAVACQACLLVHYCSTKCRHAMLTEHRNTVCVGSRDLVLRQTLRDLISDLDDYNARRDANGKKASHQPGVRIEWRLPMPFVINPAATFDPIYMGTMQGKRQYSGCMSLALLILFDAVKTLAADSTKEQELLQLVTNDRQFMRCQVCLKATQCNADLFLTGLSTSKQKAGKSQAKSQFNMLLAGHVFGIDSRGACNGWLWTACSPECMALAQPALMSHVIFSLSPSYDTGRINMLTSVHQGLGFFAAQVDKAQDKEK